MLNYFSGYILNRFVRCPVLPFIGRLTTIAEKKSERPFSGNSLIPETAASEFDKAMLNEIVKGFTSSILCDIKTLSCSSNE